MNTESQTALQYMIENRKAYDEALSVENGLGVRAEKELTQIKVELELCRVALADKIEECEKKDARIAELGKELSLIRNGGHLVYGRRRD